MSVVYYSQEDQRWKNTMYSNHGDKSQTIGTSGCGPTCMAMVASTILGRDILPPEMSQYAVARGYRTANNGTAWGFFASAAKTYGLDVQQTSSLDAVKSALAAGALVIASMGPGHFTGSGHYILLVGISGDWIEVYDPNHDNTKYGKDGLINEGTRNDGKVTAKSSVFAREAKQYWIFPMEVEQPMTKEEKQAFDAMVKRIAELEAANKRVPAPEWFEREFGSGDLGGLIKDPQMTLESWRGLAIALRAFGKGTGSKG